MVEDEVQLADAIGEGLRLQSLAVDVVYDGEAALERLGVNQYDVCVLDRDIPRVPGDKVCEQIVATQGDVRVLMLTAAGSVIDRVRGLSLGADDYLTKPFAFAELVARVRALGRRSRPAAPPVLERAGIRLDTTRYDVVRDGRGISLSRKEFAVLEELLRAEGAPVTTEQLLERAWDENIDPFTGVVRVTVLNLRRKLGDPMVIETVTGMGYQIR